MDKEKFSSRFGYVMVAAGAAVGLGNIWRFPYIAYGDGRGIFILIYVMLVALVGKAGIEIETSVGRIGHTNAVDAYGKINRKPKVIGWIGVVFTLMFNMYYVVVGRYVIKYAMDFLFGTEFRSDAPAYYNNYISNPFMPLIFTAILLLAVDFFLVSGLTGKVEKFSKIIMPILLILLLVCGGGALLSSPNAAEGLKYYLVPDFSKLNFKTVSDACV